MQSGGGMSRLTSERVGLQVPGGPGAQGSSLLQGAPSVPGPSGRWWRPQLTA